MYVPRRTSVFKKRATVRNRYALPYTVIVLYKLHLICAHRAPCILSLESYSTLLPLNPSQSLLTASLIGLLVPQTAPQGPHTLQFVKHIMQEITEEIYPSSKAINSLCNPPSNDDTPCLL